ncbi:hypothetical protein IQ265_11195 [Nodosilinea sp. LEGE 06152]|uniref:hypothetical protein n=1 Tax=Nodosilinea sp. LEGE 06152 TaxID=2777966 RepID=UPI001881D75A|nr:hypothetical protein [Nodosilinea sp. LEGE 06152]MBE9157385.1 hypothetical protein [Nodosilinea sp. LEGE 06152]
MQNHYPWNTTALIEWLKQEPCYHEKQRLEAMLNIPKHSIKSWLIDPTPTITLAQIRAIAQYRGWNLNQMIDWLELQPAHVKELIDQDMSGVR